MLERKNCNRVIRRKKINYSSEILEEVEKNQLQALPYDICKLFAKYWR